MLLHQQLRLQDLLKAGTLVLYYYISLGCAMATIDALTQ